MGSESHLAPLGESGLSPMWEIPASERASCAHKRSLSAIITGQRELWRGSKRGV